MESLRSSEYYAWLESETTKKVMAAWGHLRASLQEALYRGATLSPDSIESTALRTAELIGQLRAIDIILNEKLVDYEQED